MTKKKTWSEQRDPAWSFKTSIQSFEDQTKKAGNRSDLKRGLDADWKAFNDSFKTTNSRKTTNKKKIKRKKPKKQTRHKRVPKIMYPTAYPTITKVRVPIE